MLTVTHAYLNIDSSFICLLFLYFISSKPKAKLISREIAWYELTILKKSLVREDNAIYFSKLHLTFDMYFLIKGETGLRVWWWGMIFSVFQPFGLGVCFIIIYLFIYFTFD